MKALVVDDCRLERKLARGLLEQLGFSVVEAGDGQEGLERLRDLGRRVCLAVVDMNMPRMDGMEFVDAVARHPSLHKLRLLFVTSEDEVVGRQALIAGACAYIQKPLSRARLLEALLGTGFSRRPEGALTPPGAVNPWLTAI